MADPAIQVKTLKLQSGEELITQIINLADPDRWYMLEYPLRVEHWFDENGQDRFDLIPYLFSSDDYHLRLRTSAVACMAQPNTVMLRRYRKVSEAMANSAEAMESLHRRGHTSK
jgi:hypothetical protein